MKALNIEVGDGHAKALLLLDRMRILPIHDTIYLYMIFLSQPANYLDHSFGTRRTCQQCLKIG